MKVKSWRHLIGFVVLSQLAGVIGSVFTVGSVGTWYTALVRPELAPPNWVFGPVWITLYFLMGIAAYLVWQKGKKPEAALQLFGLQLVLNTMWSIIFFGMHNLALALAEIVLLWGAIVLTTKEFYRVDKHAAYLMAPYILWVSFAALLNYWFWVLN
ncbi:TspO/MBR family protein [archaeon]